MAGMKKSYDGMVPMILFIFWGFGWLLWIAASALGVAKMFDADWLDKMRLDPTFAFFAGAVLLWFAVSILHLLRESVRLQEEISTNTSATCHNAQKILGKMTEEKAEPKD